mgnify:FL=1|jgi:hypothetical protein
MNFIKNTTLLILLFISFNVLSQEIDTVGSLNEEINTENYIDEESLIIELQNESLKPYINITEDMLSYVNILRDKDSLVYNLCVLKGDNKVVPLIETGSLIELDRKFDLIFHPNTDKIMYVREMILNENQAWDYIYERIFDENGLTRMFIRHYSTFNSACAAVAFELSEYFFDESGEVIKKTYEIFDGEHNPLNIDNCWMDREDYVKEKSFSELNSRYNFSIEDIKQSNISEENKVKKETKIEEIEQEQE